MRRKLSRAFSRRSSASPSASPRGAETSASGPALPAPPSATSALPAPPPITRHSTMPLMSTSGLSESSVTESRRPYSADSKVSSKRPTSFLKSARGAKSRTIHKVKRRMFQGIQSAVGKKLSHTYLHSIKPMITADRRTPWPIRIMIHEVVDEVWENVHIEVVRAFDNLIAAHSGGLSEDSSSLHHHAPVSSHIEHIDRSHTPPPSPPEPHPPHTPRRHVRAAAVPTPPPSPPEAEAVRVARAGAEEGAAAAVQRQFRHQQTRRLSREGSSRRRLGSSTDLHGGTAAPAPAAHAEGARLRHSMIHQGNDEKSHHKPHSRLHLPHHLPHWHLPHGHRHHDEGGGLQEESSLSHAHADLEPKWYDRGLSLKVFGWLYDYLHQLRLSHSKASITVRVDSASGLGSGRGSTHHTRGSIAQGVAESLAGAPDPYVKLTLGGVAHTTHVARDTAEPEWDTGYTFKGEVRWLLDEPLAIQVYSRDGKSVMHDSMLGDAELAIGIPLLTSLAQRTARGVSADGYRTFDLPLSSQGAVKFSVAAVVHKPPWAQVIATVLRLDRLSYPLRRWLQGHMAASVNVHIVSGEGLRAADIGGTSDPYVKMRIGDETHVTSVIMRTLSPVWDERFTFTSQLRDFIDAPIEFRVFDWDMGSADDLLGVCYLELDDLYENSTAPHGEDEPELDSEAAPAAGAGHTDNSRPRSRSVAHGHRATARACPRQASDLSEASLVPTAGATDEPRLHAPPGMLPAVCAGMGAGDDDGTQPATAPAPLLRVSTHRACHSHHHHLHLPHHHHSHAVAPDGTAATETARATPPPTGEDSAAAVLQRRWRLSHPRLPTKMPTKPRWASRTSKRTCSGEDSAAAALQRRWRSRNSSRNLTQGVSPGRTERRARWSQQDAEAAGGDGGPGAELSEERSSTSAQKQHGPRLLRRVRQSLTGRRSTGAGGLDARDRPAGRHHLHSADEFEIPLSTKGTLLVNISLTVHEKWTSTLLRKVLEGVSTVRDALSLTSMRRMVADIYMRASTVRLIILIKSAAHLHAANAAGTSEPYVKLVHGTSCSSTRVVPGSDHPTWDEEFAFSLRWADACDVPLELQVFDDSHLTHDELMGAADLTIDTALLDSLVQRTQHAPHAAPAGAHAPAAGDAAHAPSSAHDSAPLDFTVPLATKHRGLHHVGDYFTHHHRVKGGHKTHPTISLSLSAKLTPPSTFEVLVLMCRPLFMRVKAFLVYQRMPYDRTVFSKMRDPAWWTVMVIAASPDVYVRGAFFTLLLLSLATDHEEYQLMRFILGLKGSQFISAIYKLFLLCLSFWRCAVLSDGGNQCQHHGPGVASTDSVLLPALTLLWLQGLTWGAFLLLPYAARYDPASGTLSSDHWASLWQLHRLGYEHASELDPDSADPKAGHHHRHHHRHGAVGGALSAVGGIASKLRRRRASTSSVPAGGAGHVGEYSRLVEDDSGGGGEGLRVTLISASGLLAMDSNGLSDPYVYLTLDGKRKKSAVIKKSLNPVWTKQAFVWEGSISSLSSLTLHVDVKDRDRLGKDDDLGVGTLSLGHAFKSAIVVGNVADHDPSGLSHISAHASGHAGRRTHEVNIPLSTQGSVRLRVEWLAPERASDGSCSGGSSDDEASVKAGGGGGDIESAGGGDAAASPAAAAPARCVPRWLSRWMEGWHPPAPDQSRLASLYSNVRADLRAVSAAVWVRSTRNRMVSLLLWDGFAFAFCTALYVVMVASGIAKEEEVRRAQLDHVHKVRGIDNWVGLWAVLSGAVWDTWQAKITFQVVKLVFALSSAPFFLFNVGPLARLFAHTDPTAYTRSGRIVGIDTHGLSAYLSWLQDDILGDRVFSAEIKAQFSIHDRMRLASAVRDGERCLISAWEKPASALRVTRRKKAEIDHILASIITQEAASEELFRACFPDKVLAHKYKDKLDKLAAAAAEEGGAASHQHH